MTLKIAIAHHDENALKILRRIIAPNAGCAVIWTTGRGSDVIRQCRHGLPDILLIDLELADVNGAKLICDVMKETPCAILVLSNARERQAGKVFEAMGCGALDVIATPVLHSNGFLEGADALLKKIDTMARLLGTASRMEKPAATVHETKKEPRPPLVAIGSSTGGPKALATILAGLPGNFPAAIVICQHVDSQFASGLASWLNSQTPLDVAIAREGMRPRPGAALVAQTNDHLVLGPDGSLHYTEHPRNYPYRPSVNALFESLRQYWPQNDVAILLTGMGRDGGEGLSALFKTGWHTIVQDEKTSVVYGMPAAAVELGGASEILPLDSIAESIAKKITNRKGKPS
ncbi:MAG TPA: chemotaxis-specific protein-glutamate methyltransferase CheB [Smithellaceae bacterium]|jgi:two-component system, chemotaxis family, response regulator WspF|nr:chemotaxis-specific protein-glutamate methyltransferase CheB [Smithellaceae bacterium]HPL09727.1 chemotaxis-specific protein-glutamate methyltransferase CheB [Smithellaceae bacterium]